MPHLAQHLYILLHLMWSVLNLAQVITENCGRMGAVLESQLCDVRDPSGPCPCTRQTAQVQILAQL